MSGKAPMERTFQGIGVSPGVAMSVVVIDPLHAYDLRIATFAGPDLLDPERCRDALTQIGDHDAVNGPIQRVPHGDAGIAQRRHELAQPLVPAAPWPAQRPPVDRHAPSGEAIRPAIVDPLSGEAHGPAKPGADAIEHQPCSINGRYTCS